MFLSFDFDQTTLRIDSINMLSHGIDGAISATAIRCRNGQSDGSGVTFGASDATQRFGVEISTPKSSRVISTVCMSATLLAWRHFPYCHVICELLDPPLETEYLYESEV
ncbi:hypothetical protein U6G28_04620 [Actinomycetaceae bacterium MB13-C1-2]|nr:hypothetical protein U6G28_04620 [Actinomycetaceae bacterium MB13-C1-2]